MVLSRPGRLLVAAALAVALGGCGTTQAGPPAVTSAASTPASGKPTPGKPSTAPPTTAATPVARPSATPTATRAPRSVGKVLVVIEENHSLSQMRAQMPFTAGLADRYGYASDYSAITHPSLPNYLAIVAGTTSGVTDDADPSAHRLTGPSLLGEAVGRGGARVYAEGMTTNCATESSGRYLVRHNPWVYHVAERSDGRRFDVPLPALAADARAGRLPAIGLVIPDACNDAHDCGLGTADEWLRTVLAPVLAGPDWRSGRLAVVVTADEDDRHHGNVVLTAVLAPELHHVVVRTPLSHYSLARSLAEVIGVPPPAHAATAPSLLGSFGLQLG